jgi:hypothetical protein
MITISLTSFLNILTKGSPQKLSGYSKYLTPGGYDYYWQLKKAAHALTVGGESFEACASPIENCGREPGGKHNLDNLKSLKKWIDKEKPDNFFQSPSALITSAAAHFSIKLEPEFGMHFKQKDRLVLLWSAKATLTKTAAGVGLYLLEKHLCVGDFVDCKAGILDVRKRELLVAEKHRPSYQAMVASEFAWLDSFFESHIKAA